MGRKALLSVVPPKLPHNPAKDYRTTCFEGNGLNPAHLIRLAEPFRLLLTVDIRIPLPAGLSPTPTL